MFAPQPEWASHPHPQPDKIWQFLSSAGVDLERIRRDMNDPALAVAIDQDVADAATLGVRKTPQFFVNGKALQSFGLSQLKTLVETEVEALY